MAQLHAVQPGDRAPTFTHAVEAFLIAHTVPGAWSSGTATKYRQTLMTMAGQLLDVDGGTAIAGDVATLDTAGGAAALLTAYTSMCADLAPATRARHLSTLRSALSWWRQARWIHTDPTATWAAPKVTVEPPGR